jgi:hypothetical protein
LHQESEHWAQELECQLANPSKNTVGSSSTEETEMAVEANESVEEEIKEEEEKTTTSKAMPTSTTDSPKIEEEAPLPWDAISLFKEAESVCQIQANKEGVDEELAAPILSKV